MAGRLKSNEMTKWMPKIGGKYYTVINSHIEKGIRKRIWENSDLDFAYYKKGECFKSKSEAEFILKALGNAW